MSLFRRERVFASIEPDRVSLVRLDADDRVRESAVIPVSLDMARPAGSLDAVRTALTAGAWRGTARSVVLSDRLVHYAVSERPVGVRSAAELRRACEARFRANFDRSATDWRIAVDLKPFARFDLACGITRELVDVLGDVFSSQGRTASMRPFLICELRRFARRVPGHCWFVALARDYAAIAGILNGECRLVRIIEPEKLSIAEVQAAVGREALLSGEIAADAPIAVVGILRGDAAPSMRRLDSPSWGSQSSAWASDYRLALAERWS